MSRKLKDSGIEWIGEIPEKWKILTNNKCFLLQKEIVGDNFENYQLLSLTKRGVVCKDINCNEGKLPENWNGYQVVLNNQIILCLFDLDCSAVFSGISNYNGMISPAYKILSCKKIMYSLFAEYWFRNIGNDRIYKMYSKSLRYVVNAGDFGGIPIIVPQIEEQISIADYLDVHCALIDQTIEKQKQVIYKLKEYKQSVITEAVTKGLHPNAQMKDSGIEWVGEIPESWIRRKLKYGVYIRARLGWKGLKADEYVDEGYPLLSAFNIRNEKLTFDNVNFISQFRFEESPEIIIEQGDILLVKDGAGIGKCAYVDELPVPSTVNGSIAVLTTDNRVDGKYLYYYFESKLFQKYIDRLKDGMGVPHLFQRDLRNIEIPIPSYEEQVEINEYLDLRSNYIESQIYSKIKVIEKLESYKKSLIYECITGKREVK